MSGQGLGLRYEKTASFKPSRRFPIFMRRTTPVEPSEPVEPAEPLSLTIKGHPAPWANPEREACHRKALGHRRYLYSAALSRRTIPLNPQNLWNLLNLFPSTKKAMRPSPHCFSFT